MLTQALLLVSLTSPNLHANMPNNVQFPKNFRWCVATSAHQIEGYNTQSDWWNWEQTKGHIKHNEISGAACDHWNRVEEDADLIQKLGVQRYRFSIEWAKIEPYEGIINTEALEHYKQEVIALQARGIEPLITLQHFTLPEWVAKKGGWRWPNLPSSFANYTRIVYSAVGPWVNDWITLNEPTVILAGGYIAGNMPPGLQDYNAAEKAMIGMIKAHASAYHTIHNLAKANAHKPPRVGVAHHLRVFDPFEANNPLDKFVANAFDDAFNWAFGRALESGRLKIKIPFTMNIDQFMPEAKGTQDFVGINYYSRDLIHVSLFPFNVERKIPDGAPINNLNWEIYPDGFKRIINGAIKNFPGRRIIITENGIADADDSLRSKFLTDHLQVLAQTIEQGAPIEEYCHWSLMDNFEWLEGFEPRFGLYEVDYKTQTRTLRQSGVLFSEIVKNNGF